MNIRSVPQKGVQDWIKQRVTAVFLVVYLIILALMIVFHSPLDFMAWKAVFHPLWMKIFSILAFASILVHAWVGIWTIFTDYVHPWRLRFVLMWLVLLALCAYFVWFIAILWGV